MKGRSELIHETIMFKSAAQSLRVRLEYKVLPGFEPGTSAWLGRGPQEHRTRNVLSETPSGPLVTDSVALTSSAAVHVVTCAA